MALLHSAQTLAAGVLALARTRLELFGTELQEQLARLFCALLCAVSALLLGALATAYFGLALVVSLGEESRGRAAALIGLMFLVAGAGAAWSMARFGRAGTRAFDSSLNELERDYDALKP